MDEADKAALTQEFTNYCASHQCNTPGRVYNMFLSVRGAKGLELDGYKLECVREEGSMRVYYQKGRRPRLRNDIDALILTMEDGEFKEIKWGDDRFDDSIDGNISYRFAKNIMDTIKEKP